MSIALLHAYRVANRGDGWLVELSRALVREATGTEPIVLALDPEGMGPTAKAVLPAPLRLRAGLSAALSVSDRTARIVPRLLELPDPGSLDAVLGIGGGYLRSADPAHEAIFRAHHLPQLRFIAQAGPKGAYLPVSVGPFRRGLGRVVRRELAAAAWVGVRDDRSARWLGGHAEVRRLPDLAACHLGVAPPRAAVGVAGTVGVALRSLRNTTLGEDAVDELRKRGFEIRFGVQSSVGRTNNDGTFYRNLGLEGPLEDFGSLLDSGSAGPSVVVAGRLHAALAAIAAGRPTVHVGYERKSYGAFADLGLQDYVVDAWSGDATRVADLVTELTAEPGPYWERLHDRLDHLAEGWRQLVDGVAALAGQPSRKPLLPPLAAPVSA